MERLRVICKWFLIMLLLLNGLFYMSNIIAIGNLEFMIEMHEDLSPNAGLMIANVKVINIFITGLCFLIGGISIIRKKYNFAIIGTFGTINFLLMYAYQIFMWGNEYKDVYVGLFTFGLVATLNGVVSFYFWNKRVKK